MLPRAGRAESCPRPAVCAVPTSAVTCGVAAAGLRRDCGLTGCAAAPPVGWGADTGV